MTKWHGGKGSGSRKNEDHKKYEENWEKIFRNWGIKKNYLYTWQDYKYHSVIIEFLLYLGNRYNEKAYHNNLNTHKSYRKFREKREILREKNQIVSGLDLTDTLNNYAETGSEYIKILNQIIKQNDLSDFEPVRLVNSIKKIELTS